MSFVCFCCSRQTGTKKSVENSLGKDFRDITSFMLPSCGWWNRAKANEIKRIYSGTFRSHSFVDNDTSSPCDYVMILIWQSDFHYHINEWEIASSNLLRYTCDAHMIHLPHYAHCRLRWNNGGGEKQKYVYMNISYFSSVSPLCFIL